MTLRTERVGDMLRAEINTLLLREVRDPRVKLATVARVEVSGDLRHARVAVSALGTEEEREACVAALVKARGFLRSKLASRLKRLRSTPELSFELDRAADHNLRISEILDEFANDPSA